jgi:hypothetical protein
LGRALSLCLGCCVALSFRLALRHCEERSNPESKRIEIEVKNEEELNNYQK